MASGRFTAFDGGSMRKLLAGGFLLAATIACHDATSPDNGVLAGNYVLRTANAKSVPAVAIQDATGSFEVVSGRIVLGSDFTFIDSLAYNFTPSDGPPQPGFDVRTGTYTVNGDNLVMTFTNVGFPLSYSLVWIDGNTLAYTEQGLSLIYKKK